MAHTPEQKLKPVVMAALSPSVTVVPVAVSAMASQPVNAQPATSSSTVTPTVVASNKTPLFGMTGTMEVLDLAVLFVDSSYQRGLKPHHKKIYKQMDPDACQPLTVGRREDGVLALIDGQQRRAALMLHGMKQWRCFVIPSTGPAFEARLFNKLNGAEQTQQKLTPRELFKSLLTAGNPTAHAAKEAVESGGLHLQLAGTGGWPHLMCLSKVFALTKTYGPEVVKTTCELIVEAWNGSKYAVCDFVFHGLALAVANPKINNKRLLTRMVNHSPMLIHDDAVKKIDKGSMPVRAYKAVVRMYNKGVRKENQITEEWTPMYVIQAADAKASAVAAEEASEKKAKKPRVPKATSLADELALTMKEKQAAEETLAMKAALEAALVLGSSEEDDNAMADEAEVF